MMRRRGQDVWSRLKSAHSERAWPVDQARSAQRAREAKWHVLLTKKA